MSSRSIERFEVFDPRIKCTEIFHAYRDANGELVKHGGYQYLSESKVILEQGELYNGWKTGIWHTFYESSGSVKSSSKFVQGKHEGIAREWYESGQLECETSWHENVLHGWRRSYHVNGKCKDETHYEHGYENGECSAWNSKGELLACGVYLWGEPITGTFIIDEPIEPGEEHPEFGDYVKAFLKRRFVVAEFFKGKVVRKVALFERNQR